MKKRPLIVLAVAAVIAGGMYLGKPAIQRTVYKWSLFHDDAPSDVAFTEVLDHSGNPTALVQDLWKRDRVAVRIGVLHYLRRHAIEGSSLWPSTREIVLQATRSGDIEAAENALTILENNHDAQGIAIATSMLSDLDPELRPDGADQLLQQPRRPGRALCAGRDGSASSARGRGQQRGCCGDDQPGPR